MWKTRKVSRGNKTLNQSSHAKTDGGRTGKAGEKSPTVLTVDKDGRERKWRPLSRFTAWRAGSYWEDMAGYAKIFLEKDAERNEVNAEKFVGKGGPRFWFDEKKPQPQPQQPKQGQQPQ